MNTTGKSRFGAELQFGFACLSLRLCLGLRPCLGTVSNKRLCRQTFKPSSSAAQTKPKGFKPSKKNRSFRAIFLFFLAYVQKKVYFCTVKRSSVYLLWL